MNIKGLLLGVALIILLGVGGFLYRSMVERPIISGACPADAKMCPDGTNVGRTAPACTFASCAPPNVEVKDVGIAFVLPAGFTPDENAAGADPTMIGAFVSAEVGLPAKTIIIHAYPLGASSTPISVIQSTAIGGASGEPLPPTAFSSVTIGTHRFTTAVIERFEAIVHVAYYLSREDDVLRFDSIDRDVFEWTDANLDITKLPASSALRAMLVTLQGN